MPLLSKRRSGAAKSGPHCQSRCDPPLPPKKGWKPWKTLKSNVFACRTCRTFPSAEVTRRRVSKELAIMEPKGSSGVDEVPPTENWAEAAFCAIPRSAFWRAVRSPPPLLPVPLSACSTFAHRGKLNSRLPELLQVGCSLAYIRDDCCLLPLTPLLFPLETAVHFPWGFIKLPL